jgi:hypothetical protein
MREIAARECELPLSSHDSGTVFLLDGVTLGHPWKKNAGSQQ